MRSSVLNGLVLIIIGLGILFKEWLTIPLVVGLVLLFAGLVLSVSRYRTGNQHLFIPILLLLLGFYFIIAPYVLHPFNGRSHFAFGTLFLGIDFLILAFLKRFRADYIIAAVLFTVLGTIFVLRFLRVLFSDQLIYLVDTYWPTLLILGGLALISNAMLRQRHMPSG